MKNILLILLISFAPSVSAIQNKDTVQISKLSIHPIKRTQVNNLDYYYIEKGEGETVILLHGFPDLPNTWDETISLLSKNYRCIAPFIRGYYPTSISPDGDYSVKAVAGDISQLAQNLGIDHFFLVGQDWGASIAYSVANLIPQKVTKLVALSIVHPSCFRLTPKLVYAGRHFLVFKNHKRAVRVARKNNFNYLDILYRRWSPDWTSYAATSALVQETFQLPGRLEAALGYYWSFDKDRKNKSVQTFYEQIPKMPLLLLVGEHDKIASSKMVVLMKKKMPSTFQMIVYKNAGHFLHREVPGQFIPDLSKFLKE